MKIIKATDLTHDTSTYLLYSAPGMGKTTALKFIPGKMLVLDIDKSSAVLKGQSNIDIAEIDTHNMWEEWLNTVKELINGAAEPYDTIVVDNISELFRACLANLGRIGKNNRVPSMADYQRIDFTIMDSLRALQKTGKRLVMTAWETSDTWTETSGQTFNRSMPDIRKTILTNFLGLCDVIARLTVTESQEGIRRGFILQPTQSVFAKNRLDDRGGCLVEDLIKSEGDADAD